ncbi:unnamed protein product [Peniophora sp. CBMAI 1063]|nr:unnamed protein product [Peniophora sp. CBMAI 1063]
MQFSSLLFENDGAPSSVRVSTRFNFDFLSAEGDVPDALLVTHDNVHFAVFASKLRAASFNDFGGLLLSSNTPSSIPLTSSVLNLLLHAIYGLSAAEYTREDLAAAVEALQPLGLSKEAYMKTTSTLSQEILRRAPSAPLVCYKLAAHAGIEELAVLISPYTLCISLNVLTDEDVVCIGAHYTRRLFFLHIDRVEAIKGILLPPPEPHSSSSTCDTSSAPRTSLSQHSRHICRPLASGFSAPNAPGSWTIASSNSLLTGLSSR